MGIYIAYMLDMGYNLEFEIKISDASTKEDFNPSQNINWEEWIDLKVFRRSSISGWWLRVYNQLWFQDFRLNVVNRENEVEKVKNALF